MHLLAIAIFLMLAFVLVNVILHERGYKRLCRRSTTIDRLIAAAEQDDPLIAGLARKFSGSVSQSAMRLSIADPLITVHKDERVLIYGGLVPTLFSHTPLISFDIRAFTELPVGMLLVIAGHELGHFKRRYRPLAILQYLLCCIGINVRFMCEEYAADAAAAAVVGPGWMRRTLEKSIERAKKENDQHAIREVEKRLSFFPETRAS